MGCSPIRLKLPGPAEALFPQAKQALIKQGATVRGNAISGSASGTNPNWSMIYRTQGQYLIITVTDKPFAVPCGYIEGKLRDGMAKIKAPPPPPSAPSPDAGPGDAAPDVPDSDLDPFGGPGRDIPTRRPAPPVGAQRIRVSELQPLLIALGANPTGLTDGKWGNLTAAAMDQVLWQQRGIPYEVYQISLYEIAVEPDGILELLQSEAAKNGLVVQKPRRLWPWGLGLVAVIGGVWAWRARGAARR